MALRVSCDTFSICAISPFIYLFAACGKSTFVFKLIRYRESLIDEPPEQVIYALPPGQEIHVPEDIKNDPAVNFFQGIPDLDTFRDNRPRLLVIDDQIQECGEEVVALFTRGSHHFNVSVIVLTQNIFIPTPGFRTMSLNAHYIIIFKNPRAMDQANCLARQISPLNAKFIVESFSIACQQPHSYLLLDMTQSCPEDLRYRSKIFPDDPDRTVVFIPVTNKRKKNM